MKKLGVQRIAVTLLDDWKVEMDVDVRPDDRIFFIGNVKLIEEVPASGDGPAHVKRTALEVVRTGSVSVDLLK